MKLNFLTWTEWNETDWQKAEPIYRQAFPHGAKPKGILKQMLDRRIASMHLLMNGDRAAGMAVTGTEQAGKDKLLIIDYLAVREDLRGRGLGGAFLEYIRDWAVRECGIDGILIEVEAGNTPEHEERCRFWERSGFVRTSYVHQYIWVPEPYTAMLLPLDPELEVRDNGRELFRRMEEFHRKSFSRR